MVILVILLQSISPDKNIRDLIVGLGVLFSQISGPIITLQCLNKLRIPPQSGPGRFFQVSGVLGYITLASLVDTQDHWLR